MRSGNKRNKTRQTGRTKTKEQSNQSYSGSLRISSLVKGQAQASKPAGRTSRKRREQASRPGKAKEKRAKQSERAFAGRQVRRQAKQSSLQKTESTNTIVRAVFLLLYELM